MQLIDNVTLLFSAHTPNYKYSVMLGGAAVGNILEKSFLARDHDTRYYMRWNRACRKQIDA